MCTYLKRPLWAVRFWVCLNMLILALHVYFMTWKTIATSMQQMYLTHPSVKLGPNIAFLLVFPQRVTLTSYAYAYLYIYMYISTFLHYEWDYQQCQVGDVGKRGISEFVDMLMEDVHIMYVYIYIKTDMYIYIYKLICIYIYIHDFVLYDNVFCYIILHAILP